MDSSVTLRAAQPGDAADIARLSTQLGYPATGTEVAARLAILLDAPADNAVLVVSAGESVAGWIHVQRVRRIEQPAYAEIAALVIDESRRNAGLGEQLVKAAAHWAADMHIGLLRVRSNLLRTHAHRFYQRLGFEPEKTQAVLTRHP